MPCMRPSHGAWNEGSFFSATTGPSPCLPPTSWMLSMPVLLRIQTMPTSSRGRRSAAPAHRKQALLQDRVDAEVSVDHLGDAEVDRNRHQRDRGVLGQA